MDKNITWIYNLLNFYKKQLVEVQRYYFNVELIKDENWMDKEWILKHSFYNFIYDLININGKNNRYDHYTLLDFGVPEEEIDELKYIKNKCSEEKHLWNKSDLSTAIKSKKYPWEPEYNFFPDLLNIYYNENNINVINKKFKENSLYKIMTHLSINKCKNGKNEFICSGKINKDELFVQVHKDNIKIEINGEYKNLDNDCSYQLWYAAPGFSTFTGHGGESKETRIVDKIISLIEKYKDTK